MLFTWQQYCKADLVWTHAVSCIDKIALRPQQRAASDEVQDPLESTVVEMLLCHSVIDKLSLSSSMHSWNNYAESETLESRQWLATGQRLPCLSQWFTHRLYHTLFLTSALLHGSWEGQKWNLKHILRPVCHRKEAASLSRWHRCFHFLLIIKWHSKLDCICHSDFETGVLDPKLLRFHVPDQATAPKC
jgi:hypothetical protein